MHRRRLGAAVGASPYEAFACLPNRGRYQSIEEVEKRLSYDEPALMALVAACRQPATERGAFNLLLLALGRVLRVHLKTEELGALLTWVVLAVQRNNHPVSFLRSYAHSARLSREAQARRENDWAQLTGDRAGLAIAYEDDRLVWSGETSSPDFFLRERIDKALTKLSKTQRRVFLLKQEGYTGPEIAALLKTSETSVTTRLWEAKQKLRQALSALDPRKE